MPPPRRSAVSKATRRTISIALSILALLAVVVGLFALDEYCLVAADFALSANQDGASIIAETEQVRERYQQWAINENRRVFEWHARSTKIIFWTSILVTITGICFAFWQFSDAARDAKAAASEDQLEVKSKLVSLAFTSRSLATFMMFVSIAYLLMYIKFVYPVSSVGSTPRTLTGQVSGASGESDNTPSYTEPASGDGPLEKKDDPTH
jgi:hypothetical protein